MPDYFSPDYRTASTRFLEAAERLDGQVQSITLDGQGPAGEALGILVAVLGASTPKRALIHTSGLHGVEGFPGSAVQLRVMESLEPPRDSGDSIVLVHCINPHGMAWLRRANENNVDLNRNFLFDGQAYANVSEAYRRLSPLINPERNGRLVGGFYARAVWHVLRHGMTATKQAVAEGQYEFPQGLFYGGNCLQQGPQRLLDWMQAHFQELRQAVCIDVHTGLGSFGQQSLWVDDPADSARFQQIGAHIPGIEPMGQSATGYKVRGGFLAGLAEQLPQAIWYCVTQEFGTLAPLKVLKALRDENFYHHQASAEDPSHPVKQRMLRAFSPASKVWREKILARGEGVFQEARQFVFKD